VWDQSCTRVPASVLSRRLPRQPARHLFREPIDEPSTVPFPIGGSSLVFGVHSDSILTTSSTVTRTVGVNTGSLNDLVSLVVPLCYRFQYGKVPIHLVQFPVQNVLGLLVEAAIMEQQGVRNVPFE
jgi:hypothetical protein